MQKYFFLFISVGCLLMILVMIKTGASLKTAATPKGIIDLEFAYTQQKVEAIKNVWNADGKSENILAAKINIQLDFIFLVFYTLFLHMACNKLAALFSNEIAKWGIAAATGALAAGLFDIIENLGMLLSLHGFSQPPIPLFTVIFSVLKWLLVLNAVLYCLIAGLRRLVGFKIN